MKYMHTLEEMLSDELEEITKKGKLTVDTLDAIDMITHSIKSIDTILAMENAGYSNDYPKYGPRRRGRYHTDDEYME